MNHDEPGEMPVSHLGGGASNGRRGCFFYGCLTFCFLLFMFVLLSGASLFFMSRQLVKFVNENAEDHPAELAVVSATDEEIKAIHDRLKALAKRFRTKRPHRRHRLS